MVRASRAMIRVAACVSVFLAGSASKAQKKQKPLAVTNAPLVVNFKYDLLGRVASVIESRVRGGYAKPTMTEKHFEYNSNERVVAYSETVYEKGDVKTTTVFTVIEYDALGEVENETVVEMKRGEKSDIEALLKSVRGVLAGVTQMKAFAERLVARDRLGGAGIKSPRKWRVVKFKAKPKCPRCLPKPPARPGAHTR